MKKFWNWFISSNHYKHFIGGWIIGFGITGWIHSIYAVAIAASCLEYKDQAYGNNWDWSDWWCTVIGGLLGQLAVYLLMNFGKLFL